MEEMARKTIQRFLDSYSNTHFYDWEIESEGQLIGTVGAYDYDQKENSIEIGISIARSGWGKDWQAKY